MKSYLTYYFYPGDIRAAGDRAWLYRVCGNKVHSKQLINVTIKRWHE